MLCWEFDHFIQSLLSTAVLKLLLARGQHAAAAKCCLHRADVSSEQLTEICNSFMQETGRKLWLNCLLLDASNASTAQLLLDLGADAGANNEGVTALMMGHEAVAKLLLEHGADARPATNNGVMALRAAAESGREAVAKSNRQSRWWHGTDRCCCKWP